jgi:hypothetical protein
MNHPCDIKEHECPLDDDGFLVDLAWYLYGNNPLPCITGKFQHLDDKLYSSSPDIEPVDISLLWPNDRWVIDFHWFFRTGLMIDMSKELCAVIKAARERWFIRLAPLDYVWRGPPRKKPDRLRVFDV